MIFYGQKKIDFCLSQRKYTISFACQCLMGDNTFIVKSACELMHVVCNIIKRARWKEIVNILPSL